MEGRHIVPSLLVVFDISLDLLSLYRLESVCVHSHTDLRSGDKGTDSVSFDVFYHLTLLPD